MQDFHWLNERQFTDAVAVAMITPGPVVITVAFIGFLVAGFAGATLAALGIFLPVYVPVLGLVSLGMLWRFKLHEPVVVAAAGLAGLVLWQLVRGGVQI